MALAAAKTWSFHTQHRSYEGDLNNHRIQWFFDLKELLVSMGWQVRGGYSVSQGLHHNDGTNVDVWPTWQDASRSTNQDTYIIMRAPVALGFEVCFGSNLNSGNSWIQYPFFYVSQAGFFGATESGANGTSGGSSIPPTAADQVQHLAHNNYGTLFPDTGSFRSMYGAKTLDGKNQRVIIQWRQGVHCFLSFEHLANPAAALENGGRVHAFRFTDKDDLDNAVMDNLFYTSTYYRARVAGVAHSLYVGTSGYANLGHQSLNLVLADSKMLLAPCDIYNNNLGYKGYYGTIPDLYWGNNGHFSTLMGDTVGGPANWFSGGSLVTPWDPTEPTPRFQ